MLAPHGMVATRALSGLQHHCGWICDERRSRPASRNPHRIAKEKPRMMPLSVMWSVDRLTNVNGANPLAERIVERWPHDPGSVRFFRSSANFLYVFRHDGKQRFLRFAHGSERRRKSIDAEIALVRWLAEEALAVVHPVRSRHERFVETVASDLGTFHAVVFDALEGSQFEIDELDDAHFGAWGAALGRLHATLRRYPGRVSSARSTVRDHLEQAKHVLPEDAPAVWEELYRLESSLDALPVDQDTYGIIHFDFELDNLIWQGRTAQMLDFDDCSFAWYAADIAFALRDCFDAGADFATPSVRAFLAGYAAQTQLTDQQIAQIPLFSRLARLIQFGRIARVLDLARAPVQPDWLGRLIDKLEDRMDAYQLALVGE
jgi:Ser/Thr protein kinase RdoA (MazF antagonist)